MKRLTVLVAVTLALSGCVPGAPAPLSQVSQTDVLVQSIQLLSQRRFSEALTSIKTLRPMTSVNSATIMAFAVASDMQGDFGASTRAYARLADSYAQRVDLLNNMGYSMMLQGKLDKALIYLREAQRLDPKNVVVRNNLKMLTSVVPTR
jgi:Flp pilus assembly protein TadD